MQCEFNCHCEKPLENKYAKLSQYLMNQQTDEANCNPHSTAAEFKYNANAYDI